MTSLAEAYDRRAGEVGRERLYLGTALFLAGAIMVVLAIVAGATTLPTDLGVTASVYDARELAGTLAGLGVPAVFVGIFAVLPASTSQRAAAAIGAGLAVLGVVLFRAAYPFEWYAAEGVPSTMTLVVAMVYFFGVLVTFWCVFTAVATFKRRNDPGGTVTLTYTEGGEQKTVRVAADDADDARAALGSGIGVFGGVEQPDDDGGSRPGTPGNAGTGAVSDGGAAASDGPASGDGASTQRSREQAAARRDDDGEVLDRGREDETDLVDRYCGNCAQFDYVRTDSGIQRYCGYRDELMDDMDPCDHWEPNN